MRPQILLVITLMVAASCSTGLDAARAASGGDTPIVIDDNDRPDQPASPTADANSRPYVDTVQTSIDDIQAFWTATMPQVYGQEFQPIPADRIFAYNSTTPPPACGPGGPTSYRELAGNAFYCTEGDFIAFDDEGLFPQLYDAFGSYAIAMVLAHEWGHVVQDQVGDTQDVPTVYLEQQADCFAGAWTKWVADGESDQLNLSEGSLDAALGGMLAFRDEPGSSAGDPAAHGSGFDRVRAFHDGFRDGAQTCVSYADDPPEVLQLPWSYEEYQTGGNLAYSEVVNTILPDITAWMKREFPDYTRTKAQPYDPGAGSVRCGTTTVSGDELEDRAFYCASDNTVRWDSPWLEQVNSNGDFAASLLLGLQYGVALQSQSGKDGDFIDSEDGIDQRVCIMGAYAGSLVDEFSLPSQQRQHEISISGGDLDEAIQALIAFTSPEDRSDVGSSLAFQRIEKFQQGVLRGVDACGL